MTTTDSPVHLLSLKVMRVSRPELASVWQPFYSSSPSFSAHSSAGILSLQGTTPLPGHPKTLRDLTHASELLTLPASFGSIQLGETFSSCLCVNNETEVAIEVTQVKVEMQTVTTKVVLYETEGPAETLPGDDTLEYIVNHEIKELGQHVLACTITYRLPPNSRSVPGASEDTTDPSLQTFRKFYKFAVTNPLSVKTKVHSPKSPSALLSPLEREKTFLEVHIQNLTQDAIVFERMRLECTDGWKAIDGNIINDENGNETSIFNGSTALMQPQDMRQYVYTLVPKSVDLLPPTPAPGTIIPLGRLDIFWRSSFGEPGRLLTSMLSRRIPLPPAPQPASALPPHFKRNIANSVPSRPQSPSINQSRPATPPPSQRPGSPALNRPSSVSLNRPQSPQHFTSSTLPEIEAHLIVRRIPRENLLVEKPFFISFSVVISSTIPLGKKHLKRNVKLAIQHIRPRNEPPPVPLQPVEVASPRLPSSGFSTPSSATATFNYALAHQKILAASNRPPVTEALASDSDISNVDPNLLPPPYFDGVSNEEKKALMAGVSFLGASAIFLPQTEIVFPSAESTGETPSLRGQAVQEFDLSFIALRKGFSAIGGIRILLVDDQLVDSLNDEAETKAKSERRAHILKEYDVVGEIWVSA
ncbi:hypothetical protein CPB84DRAFT_1745251 [Gymnopilus junonius]|uniref:DUF974-domain-containing protein n=1 Tax=Gymnopilus junonius TaxID=109634 RepID=A0A9P5TPV4_GYMJU|nr:hypothetical protein CPB84DRAFT_1745251 [Gymnopilus junonius]